MNLNAIYNKYFFYFISCIFFNNQWSSSLLGKIGDVYQERLLNFGQMFRNSFFGCWIIFYKKQKSIFERIRKPFLFDIKILVLIADEQVNIIFINSIKLEFEVTLSLSAFLLINQRKLILKLEAIWGSVPNIIAIFEGFLKLKINSKTIHKFELWQRFLKFYRKTYSFFQNDLNFCNSKKLL